jgi:hypothetical protein
VRVATWSRSGNRLQSTLPTFLYIKSIARIKRNSAVIPGRRFPAERMRKQLNGVLNSVFIIESNRI